MNSAISAELQNSFLGMQKYTFKTNFKTIIFTPMMESSYKLELSWANALKNELQMPYFQRIYDFIQNEKNHHKIIFPPENLIFNALNSCPFQNVKVVILGQDPYHGSGQAHGLAFSVPNGIPAPPSLRNILKELQNDLGLTTNLSSVDLSSWATQGVLLLNAILTVNKDSPASHKAAGWELFTDAIIHTLASQQQHLVFILWGNYAQRKKALIESYPHLILEAAHPSPLSAYRGFFGSQPFTKTNLYLEKNYKTPINWQLPVQLTLFDTKEK